MSAYSEARLFGWDPDAMEPIGRQPARCYVTPSKPYPWYGGIVGGKPNERTADLMADSAIVGGERFTRQQTVELINRRMDAAGPTVLGKRQATDRELVCGPGQMPAVFAFECPVIRRRTDGAILVISPSGQALHVCADGWVKPPRRRPRAGW